MAIISIPTSLGGISAQGELGSVLSGPLASLFGGQGVTTIKYPSDLATSGTQSHYVMFSIKKVVPAGYGASSPAGSVIPATGLGGSALAGGLVNSVASTVANLASGAANLAAGSSGILGAAGSAAQSAIAASSAAATKVTGLVSGLLTNGLKISPQTTQSMAYISLYMPDTLNASYNAQYEELSLTADNKLNTLRMVEQLAEGAVDSYSIGGLDALGSKIMSAISTDPAAVYLAMQGINGLKPGLVSDNMQSLLLKGQGYAINPQLQMIYKGIDLRSFSLSFVFTPKSAQEAKDVKQILYMFKRSFAPSLQPGKTVSNDSMFLVPPDIFNINFKLNGNDNTFLPAYGDCVLTGIDVDYAPNGWAAYSDGSPVQTKLNLTFREIEMVTRERLDAGQGPSTTAAQSSILNSTPVAGTTADLAQKATSAGFKGIR